MPVNILEKLFGMFQRKLEGLFHFGTVAFDIFGKRTVRYIQDLITLISGKASCIVKERFIRAISDTRENNGQLRGVVISFRCMRGSFVIEHLQPVFRDCAFVKTAERSVAEDVFARGVCLPSDTKMTPEQQAQVCAVIRGLF